MGISEKIKDLYAPRKDASLDGFLGKRFFMVPPRKKRLLMQNQLIRGFYFTDIGHYPKAEDHGIERKNGCPQYILIYCTDGEGSIAVSGIEYKVSPNSYFIIPKSTHHSYYSDVRNPWSIYWVHFAGDIAQLLFERSLVNDQLLVHPIPFEQSRIELFEQIYSILDNSYQARELEVINLSVLHFICAFVYFKETNPFIHEADIVTSSIAFMKKNLDKKFEIEELAFRHKISTSHYYRIFKKRTGSSPINYFNHLKIQKACQYLYFTDTPIKEICFNLSFQDPFYFSRLFRKIMGVSPVKYKQLYKGN